MWSDGAVLPDLGETAVLLELGLVRTDQLPWIATHWLAGGLLDGNSIRMLAGHNPRDRWELETLLEAAIAESDLGIKVDQAERRRIAVDWIAANWRLDGNTRGAVESLSRLSIAQPDWGLDEFVGLDDEWIGGWGRPVATLRSAAAESIESLVHDRGNS